MKRISLHLQRGPSGPKIINRKMKTIDLTQVGAGREVRVSRLDCAPGTCQRLREMGFCENALVKKIRGGADLVCWVCGTRVALSARLARQILVETVDGNS